MLGMREITVNYCSFPSLFPRFLSSSLRACSGLASSLLLVSSRTICSCLIFGPNCQLFGTNLRLCTIRNALFPPSINRDLGFYKNEASFGPFRSAKTVHNRKFLPFFAESGHGLGRVGPFGLAVEGFMGGVLWEWTRKSLLGKRCDSPIGRALRKFACDSARRKRMRKSPTTQV